MASVQDPFGDEDSETDLQDTSDNPASSDSGSSIGDEDDLPAMVWNASTPHDHKGITTMEATMALCTSIIGAGIMALPALPSKGGIFPAVIAAVLGAIATFECCSAYFKGFFAFNKRQAKKKDRIVCFEDFGIAAAGKPGAIVIRVSVIVWFVGAMSGYVILMANQLANITGSGWDYRYFVAGIAPVLWFLCMLRDVSAVAKLLPLAVLGAFGSCLLIVLAAYRGTHTWEQWSDDDQQRMHSYWPENGFMALGSVAATLIGAFAVMPNCPPIIEEMRYPKKFPKALRMALSLVTGLYLCVMVVGYWGYGNCIQSNILISMSYTPANATEAFGFPAKAWSGPRHHFIGTMLSCCVFTNLVLSYPLCMMSVFASIQSLSCAKPGLQPGTFRNYVMRTAFVASTVFIATVVNNFGVVFGVFAAVCMPVMGMAIPIVFAAMIRNKVGARGSSAARWGFHGVILLVAVFTLVFGFIDSFNSLIKEMR